MIQQKLAPTVFQRRPMWKWQEQCVETAKRILIDENKKHLYVQAPTSAGKSRVMLEIIDNVKIDGSIHYIMIGRDNIVNQHIKSFEDEGCEYYPAENFLRTPEGNKVKIVTWQSMTADANKNVQVGQTGYLFFDECHLGGSGKKGELTSIPKIFKHYRPTKKCLVSATTLTCTEEVLGTKKDHTFTYTTAEAMQDGILHPVDLVEIHVGTNAKIAELNNALKSAGTNIQKLDECEAVDLNDMREQFKTRGVIIDPEMMDEYQQFSKLRLETAARIYLEKHYAKQALMFVGNIETAERASINFNKMSQHYKHSHKHLGAIRSRALNSKSADQEKIIEDFRAGKIDVLFVVGMLQEGFSHNPLALAFDCTFKASWNDSSISRLIQRVGRLMRLDNSKVDPSRYYFFRDILDYYPSEPIMPSMDEHDALTSSAEEFTAMIAATTDTQDIDPEDLSIGDRTVDVSCASIEEINLDDDADNEVIDTASITQTRKAILITTPLWYLKNTRGHKEVKTFSFITLFGNSVAKKKEQLLEMARNGEQRPHKRSTLGRALDRYTNKNGKSYYEDFDEEIHCLAPHWYNKVDINKERLLEMARNGEQRPPQSDALGRALSSYTDKNSDSYYEDFDEEIHCLAPHHWFAKNDVEKNKEELLEMARNGEQRPHKRSTLGIALNNYTNKNSKSYYADFDKEIRRLAPHWFRK